MRAREAGRPPVPVEHVELTSQHALQTARAADVIDHDQPLSFHLNHKTPRAEDSLYEVLPAVDVDDSPEAQLGHVATEDAVLDHHPTIRDGQHRAEPPAEASQHPQCWKRHEHDQDPIQNPWRARELDECGDSSGDGDSRQQRRSQQPGPVRVLRDEHTLAFEVQVVHASVSVARGQSPIAEVWGIRRRSSGTTDRGPSDQRGEGWRECVPAQLRRCPSPRSDCQPLWARGGVSGSVSRPALCSEALGALSPSCGPKPLQRPRTAPRHARLVPHRFPSQDSVRPTREPTPGTAPMALGSPHPRVGPSARTLPPAAVSTPRLTTTMHQAALRRAPTTPTTTPLASPSEKRRRRDGGAAPSAASPRTKRRSQASSSTTQSSGATPSPPWTPESWLPTTASMDGSTRPAERRGFRQ